MKALLAAPTVAKTTHFGLQSFAVPLLQELSTEEAPDRNRSVDISSPWPMGGFALVVPKRHARRAVTRNLVKRQMREALHRHTLVRPLPALLIRQRAAFDRGRYPSAASAALREAVRRELDQLFARAGVQP